MVCIPVIEMTGSQSLYFIDKITKSQKNQEVGQSH